MEKSEKEKKTFLQKLWNAPFWLVKRYAKPFLFAYCVMLTVMYLFENDFVYAPHKYHESEYKRFKAGYRAEDVFFESADKTKLHGWYLEHPNPDHYMIIFHGNGGNILNTYQNIDLIHECSKCSIFVFDYRGYGRSEGSPFEEGVIADAEAARDWLCQREGIKPDEIVLYGISLGGALAVDLASKTSAKGLLVKSSFANMPRVAVSHMWWFPMIPYIMSNEYDSVNKIPKYDGPLLMVHGTADTIVPYWSGQELFQAANEPKDFVTLEGEGHLSEKQKENTVKYTDAVLKFLSSLPASAPDNESAPEEEQKQEEDLTSASAD